MAYFSNGTEGMAYQAKYCDRCANNDGDGGCPIWDLHLLWNSAQVDSINAIYEGASLDDNTASGAKHMALSTFIPEDGGNGWPGQCRMFIPIDADGHE